MKLKLLTCLLALLAAHSLLGQQAGDWDKRQVIDWVEPWYLFKAAPFESCHASTIAETADGDLVVACYGGSYEGCEDVCIWVTRLPKGAFEWTEPAIAADGVLSDTLRKACYNPVLQQMPNGELWLFFKIGSCVADWTGWLTKSRDGGKTWSQREPLPEGFLGPSKNKPLLLGDRLICPSSTEKDWWRIHFEILDLNTNQWHKTAPVKAAKALTTMDKGKRNAKRKEIMCIQPTLLQMADGSLKALCRTKNGRIATTTSRDGGETWSEVTLTDLPNNNSGIDAVTLRDGRHVLVYNNQTVKAGKEMGPRTRLAMAISDDGEHWKVFSEGKLDPEGEISYPAIIQGSNGHLYVTVTNQRKTIDCDDITLK
ncbi:MAG: exo-alpha-sialidase [Muribaculaceae bacterium]|nr:exo-alpha-sialidase [Muribaculaceae bacterium]